MESANPDSGGSMDLRTMSHESAKNLSGFGVDTQRARWLTMQPHHN
jgi:hypothetical protein